MGVVGYPIGHNLGPRMHDAAFAAGGMYYVYDPLDGSPERLPADIEGVAEPVFRGSNVTMPNNESMESLLDEVKGAGRVAGAVNTALIENDSLRGVNIGFAEGGCRGGACETQGPDPGRRALPPPSRALGSAKESRR